MFRNILLVILAFLVLGTAPVDAQLFRRVRSAVQKARQTSNDLQRQNLLKQQSEKRDSSNQKDGQIRPAQQGAQPTLAKPRSSKSANPAEDKQNFAIFVDGRTGRRSRRPVESAPEPNEKSPQLARQRPLTTAGPKPDSVKVGQFDIARQAIEQAVAKKQPGPTPNQANPINPANQSVLRDSNVVRTSKTEPVTKPALKKNNPKKLFSVLESRQSDSTEPEKPKPVIIPELNGPDDKK